MTTYATATSVSEQASRAEIERTLARYGATRFAYLSTPATIAFELAGLRYRFSVPLPDPQDDAFRYTPHRRLRRSVREQHAAYEQAVRQRWRALALLVKATLEAVEAGIVTLHEALLAHVVLPQGDTVGEALLPRLDALAETGELPALLLLGEPRG